MYEELVKSLRVCGRMTSIDDNCISYVNGCCEAFPDCAYALMDQAANAIEGLQQTAEHYHGCMNEWFEAAQEYKAAVPKWIPVTERLPPAKKEVYVTDGEYIARANLLDEVFPGDKPCWSYSGLGEITHWCEQIPLPEPPKEW